MRQIRIIIAILLLRVLPTMVFESKKIRFFQNQVITKKTVDFPKGLICQDKPPGTPIKPLSPTDIIPNINFLFFISSHDLYGDSFFYVWNWVCDKTESHSWGIRPFVSTNKASDIHYGDEAAT